MNKIKRSGKMLKAAFAVLLRERKLLLFPFVATGFALAIAMFFIAPIVFYPTGHSCFSAAHWSALASKAGNWFNVAPDQHGHMQVPSVNVLSNHPVTVLFFTTAYFVSMFWPHFATSRFIVRSCRR